MVQSGLAEQPSRAVRPPLGTYPARVDEKGRLKLPAKFQQYLESIGKELFVTSLDMVSARIYPISVWHENAALFRDEHDDPQAAGDMWFLAQHNGADAELDAQGRVLIHPELRRRLGMENQQVYLECFKGRINVYSQASYEARFERAQQNMAENLLKLERKGLL